MLLGCCLLLAAMVSQPPVWEFGPAGDPGEWKPAANITGPSVADGRLRFSIPDSIGYFVCSTPDFRAEPYQCVVIRLKASRPGEGNLLWAGDKLPYATWDRRAPFQVKKTGWQTIVVFPFWQSEGNIRQLRLDLYGPAAFEIDSIRVVSWADGKSSQEIYSWELRNGIEEWRVNPDSDCFFAPPVAAKLENRRIASVKLRSTVDCECAVLYSHQNTPGLRRHSFRVRGDGGERTYNIALKGFPANRGVGTTWPDPIVAFGLEIPQKAQSRVTVQSVSLADKPSGPPDLQAHYLGFENAVNRSGKACSVVAEITNTGGGAAANATVRLVLPKGLRLAEGKAVQSLSVAPMSDPVRVVWPVIAKSAGTYPVELRFEDRDARPVKTALRFLAPVTTTKARYVPKPRPVGTDTDLFMYYFPGWDNSEWWNCIRRDTPSRKPWLGYYDETNPEVVDWQIKAAVENGITGFVVDWYWWDGKPEITHWIDTYGKARYRDYLKIYVMWCNHVGTHTVEDLRKMTKYCADNYFGWKSYYRLNGKPVMVIYQSDRLREQLGGSEAVKQALDACEAVAKEAGYPGITFIESGMRMLPAPELSQSLSAEGYSAYMTYHDNLLAYGLAPSSDRIDYADVVRTAPAAWEAKRQAAAKLTYIPLVETGWDPRPWHGESPQTMIIRNRTPELFEELLRKAKKYSETNKPPFVLLGPANEWGEGSYIEPCIEYGFDMYERVRKVFGKGDPADWPVNLAPSDLGLGPYDARPAR